MEEMPRDGEHRVGLGGVDQQDQGIFFSRLLITNVLDYLMIVQM